MGWAMSWVLRLGLPSPAWPGNLEPGAGARESDVPRGAWGPQVAGSPCPETLDWAGWATGCREDQGRVFWGP